MRVKPLVIIAGLQLEMRPALVACQRVMDYFGVEFVIVSGLEGTHSAGSLHYYGYAIDVRTRELSKHEQRQAASRIKAELGGGYDVILEQDHIHIEYDAILAMAGESNLSQMVER